MYIHKYLRGIIFETKILLAYQKIYIIRYKKFLGRYLRTRIVSRAPWGEINVNLYYLTDIFSS